MVISKGNIMTFNDLKLGMQFKLYSEDNQLEFSICKILVIYDYSDYRSITFDDVNSTTVYGNYEKPLHNFMEFLK
jgi:hypothetical protein